MARAETGKVMHLVHESEFLAVDLEIVSRFGLAELLQAFGQGVSVNRNEKVGRLHVLLLSVDSMTRVQRNPENHLNAVIQAVVEKVESLPVSLRRHWDTSKTKTFDIGIQAGKHPMSLELKISEQTLAAMVRIGARLQVTVYGASAVAR